MKDQIGYQVKHKVGNLIWVEDKKAKVVRQVWIQLGGPTWFQIWDQLGDRVYDQVENQVWGLQ